jgi:uncharacterized protein (UPF0305 family)
MDLKSTGLDYEKNLFTKHKKAMNKYQIIDLIMIEIVYRQNLRFFRLPRHFSFA